VTFRADRYRLAGRLHLPDVPQPPVVIGSHGLFGTADSAKQLALAKACTSAGFGYFRFDHRGCGNSSGEFSQVTSLDGRVQDLLTAIEIITGRDDASADFGVFGSSFGGTVSIASFGARQPAALVLCAAPVRSADIDPDRAQPIADTEINPPRPENLRFDVSGKLAALRDVLIFHGDRDEVVPYRHAGEIMAAAADPKKMITLPEGDHRMTDPVHQSLFIDEAVRWFRDRFPANGDNG
jgi:alpha-beta hydrolase superfamily lysophospholipase